MINIDPNYKPILKHFSFNIFFLPYNELKKEVQKKHIKTMNEYLKKRKSNWPSNPPDHYKTEWENCYAFFGKTKIKFLSYKELKKEVLKNNIKTRRQYLKHRKSNWPSNPPDHYKTEWENSYAFFGKPKIKFLRYSELKKEIRKKNIKNKNQYLKHRKSNWPSNPSTYYKEWEGCYAFFGKEKLSYEKLKKEVRSKKIKTRKQYLKNRKSNWPYNPNHAYKEWEGWSIFSGA